MITIPIFDLGTSEERIIFVDLVQKALVGQNATTGSPTYKCMKKVLKGEAKTKLTKRANLVRSLTVTNFTTVMNMYRYLMKPKRMKVRTLNIK